MIVKQDILLPIMENVHQHAPLNAHLVIDLINVKVVSPDILNMKMDVSNVINLIAIYVKKPTNVLNAKMVIYPKTVSVSQFVKIPV